MEETSYQDRPARNLHFPEDKFVGRVELIPKISHWEVALSEPLNELEARGNITVEEGTSLTLRVAYESSKNLSWLDRLGPQDVQSLDLSGTGILDDQLKHISNLRQLDRLEMANTGVTDEGLVVLKTLEGLCELGLADTKITDDAITYWTIDTVTTFFCVIEAPDPQYPYHEKKPLWVDAGSSNSDEISTSIRLPGGRYPRTHSFTGSSLIIGMHSFRWRRWMLIWSSLDGNVLVGRVSD